MHKYEKYINIFYEKIFISLSSTFLARSRCKKCGSTPSAYFYIRNKFLYHDYKSETNMKNNGLKKFCKRICSNYYTNISPKYFHNLKSFSVVASFKGYSPKLHNSNGRILNLNITEFLMCDCGETTWAYEDKSIRGCPEILNRRSRNKYDINFEY